jgi:signal transduction histidine kinase
MVKKIVDIHNGIIDVASKVDEGTCFKVALNKA